MILMLNIEYFTFSRVIIGHWFPLLFYTEFNTLASKHASKYTWDNSTPPTNSNAPR